MSGTNLRKTIKILESLRLLLSGADGDALVAAIESVKRDEHKMVNYIGDGYADGKMVFDSASCPNCGHTIEEGETCWKSLFCPKCGQALKW